MAGCVDVVKTGMRLILLGPPGAGKGTQADLLAERHGITSLASGDILRDAIRRNDPIGRQASRYVESGALVPDDLVTGLILRRLDELGKEEPFVLDGFPRTEAQARVLDARLSETGYAPVDRVIDFEISEDEIIRRLAGRRICDRCGANYHLQKRLPSRPGVCDRCGGTLRTREDDRQETIRRRLAVYHEQTEPLLQFYRVQGKLRVVPGNLEIEDQYRALLNLLKGEGLV